MLFVTTIFSYPFLYKYICIMYCFVEVKISFLCKSGKWFCKTCGYGYLFHLCIDYRMILYIERTSFIKECYDK